jgi:DNA sulfur modification protein DndC
VVTPPLDKRFYVYMLGYGVPPPGAHFRWCTGALKIAPMTAKLEEIRQTTGEKFLLINGVRLGESAARDQRIALSCSKNSGECGQGYFQVQPPASAGDTLAPLLHWRLCHVYDWLYFEQARHGYEEVAGIAAVYGDEEVRTGCIACPVASKDVALENLSRQPAWDHLAPLLELRAMFNEMRHSRWRKRKAEIEVNTDGTLASNGQRKGPLTMEARAYWLERVLDVQRRVNEAAAVRPGVDLINAEEEARIHEMWALDMWPRKWSADDIAADLPIDRIAAVGGDLIVQPLLVR